MAVSDVSTAESAFRSAVEAPRGAGTRAAGDGATRAALRKQIARLEAATGWNAQVEAMSRAARKTQLWNILRERLADDPALVQVVSELERLDEVSPSSRPSFGQMQDAVPEQFFSSGVEALAMREVARGLRDIFTLNGPGRVARVLLALRDA